MMVKSKESKPRVAGNAGEVAGPLVDLHKSNEKVGTDRRARSGGMAINLTAFRTVIFMTFITLLIAAAALAQPGMRTVIGKQGADRRQAAGPGERVQDAAWNHYASNYADIRRGCFPAVLAAGYPDLLRDAIAGLCVGVPMGELRQIGIQPRPSSARRASPKAFEKAVDLWFGLDRV